MTTPQARDGDAQAAAFNPLHLAVAFDKHVFELRGGDSRLLKFSFGLLLLLIAVRNAEKTWKLVNQDASPHHGDEGQKSDSEQKSNRIRQDAVSRSYGSHYRHQDDDEGHW